MDKLVEGLGLVEEVNQLLENLQESLELFKRGKDDKALARINSVVEGIESLNVGDLPEERKIEEKLSYALADLEWIKDNADRVKGGKVEE